MVLEQTHQRAPRPQLAIVTSTPRRARLARTTRGAFICLAVIGTAVLAFTFGYALQEFLVRVILVILLVVVAPLAVWLAIDTLRSLR